MTPNQRMLDLVKTFPAMAKFVEPDQWDALHLAQCYGVASSGERRIISFLLTVWNTDQDLVPKFNVVEALASWDHTNRKAFAAWVAKPFTC